MSSSDPAPGRLVVRSPGAALEVLDPWLEPLSGSGAVGELSLEVAPGAYQISARIGGTEKTRLVVVRSGDSIEIDVPVEFDAAAPVEGTTTADEAHGDLARDLTGPISGRPATAVSSRSCSLVLILRGFRDQEAATLVSTEAPFELLDQRGTRVHVPPPTLARQNAAQISPAAGWAVPLRPGGYRLRWAGLSGQPVEHAVWLSPGWQTLLFVPYGTRGPSLPEMSVHLLRTGSSWDRHSPGWLAVEVMFAALRGAAAHAVDPRSADFVTDADNPMLALLTLHILGRAHRAGVPGPALDHAMTKRIEAGIRRLRRSLGWHPDVAALAELWSAGSRGWRPWVSSTPWPPSLAASLDLLLAAEVHRPKVILAPKVIPTRSLTEAVSGQRYASSPWLLWDPRDLRLEPPPRRPLRVYRTAGRRVGPRATPTSGAIERVEDLLDGVAHVLQISPAEAAQRLGTRVIAQRLGMAGGIAGSCIEPALSRLRRAEPAATAASAKGSKARARRWRLRIPTIGLGRKLEPHLMGYRHMDDGEYQKIKQTAWKADVLDRLGQVKEDVKRAISAAGWEFDGTGDVPQIRGKGATAQGDALAPQQREAQTVVNTTYSYIKSTEDTLKQPNWLRRFWDVLTGDALMSAYTNLHAAESTRVLLLSSGQLAAILPSIRQRAAAFLPKGDPNSDALATIPDPTVPTHQAVAARVQAQAGQVTGQKASGDNNTASNSGAGPGPTAGDDQTSGNDQAAGNAQTSGNADQGQQPSPAGTVGPAPLPADKLTGILGTDQQIASQVMNAACRAEDQQQLQVRHFRGVLFGAATALFVVAVVLWIVGSIHPAYFPLCWPVSGTHSGTMICPTGGSAPSAADVPLVLGIGALGAALSVALNLTGLNPAGVRFSLTVAQGLNKIVLGAITAVLGIIILRTVTNEPGFLATQPGLLTAAVVFGYSQQVFTGVIDRQAKALLNAASSTTPAAQPAK
jgi:hypothetical protein